MHKEGEYITSWKARDWLCKGCLMKIMICHQHP